MKNIIILLLLLSILSSCRDKARSGFIIDGTTSNKNISKIYLKILPPIYLRTADDYLNPMQSIVDSAPVINGKFHFESDSLMVDAKDASLCYLPASKKKLEYIAFNYKNTNTTGFVIDKDRPSIKIEADENDVANISGSEETELQFKYFGLRPSKTFYKSAAALKSTVFTINIKQKYQIAKQFKVAKNAFVKKLIDLQKDYPTSTTILTLIWHARLDLDVDDLDFIVEQSAQSYSTPLGKQIVSYIEKQRSELTVGKVLPAFKLADTTGKLHTLDELKGQKMTLIVFWSRGCVPCRQEIPELKSLYKKYNNKGLNIISISLDDHKEDWVAALDNENMPWPNLNNYPRKHTELSLKYQCESIPLTYLLDSRNRIVIGKQTSLEANSKYIHQYLALN